jgi:hypothetical protein
MEKLNVIEKIAMLWVIPIAVAAVAFLTITGAAIWLLRAVLVYSGTIGALGWLAKEMQNRYKRSQWAKLKREDKEMRDFDKRFEA